MSKMASNSEKSGLLRRVGLPMMAMLALSSSACAALGGGIRGDFRPGKTDSAVGEVSDGNFEDVAEALEKAYQRQLEGFRAGPRDAFERAKDVCEAQAEKRRSDAGIAYQQQRTAIEGQMNGVAEEARGPYQQQLEALDANRGTQEKQLELQERQCMADEQSAYSAQTGTVVKPFNRAVIERMKQVVDCLMGTPKEEPRTIDSCLPKPPRASAQRRP